MDDGSHRVGRPPRRWRRWLLAILLVLAIVVPVTVAVVREVRGTLEPVPFASAEVKGTSMSVDYVGSECRDEASVEVEESVDRVVVTVLERVGASSCSDVGVLYTIRGSLAEPLGDRQLIDGACLTEEWRDRPACVPPDRNP